MLMYEISVLWVSIIGLQNLNLYNSNMTNNL
jgi:hypothetical protein